MSPPSPDTSQLAAGELYQYLMDVGLNVTVTMVLIVGACMV